MTVVICRHDIAHPLCIEAGSGFRGPLAHRGGLQQHHSVSSRHAYRLPTKGDGADEKPNTTVEVTCHAPIIERSVGRVAERNGQEYEPNG